jgi:aldehyde dehydrogenase (NAD+)
MAGVTSKATELLIDGQLMPGGAGRFATIKPATSEPLGEAPDGDGSDMDRAIGAARRAFDGSHLPRDVAVR